MAGNTWRGPSWEGRDSPPRAQVAGSGFWPGFCETKHGTAHTGRETQTQNPQAEAARRESRSAPGCFRSPPPRGGRARHFGSGAARAVRGPRRAAGEER